MMALHVHRHLQQHQPPARLQPMECIMETSHAELQFSSRAKQARRPRQMVAPQHMKTSLG